MRTIYKCSSSVGWPVSLFARGEPAWERLPIGRPAVIRDSPLTIPLLEARAPPNKLGSLAVCQRRLGTREPVYEHKRGGNIFS